MKIVRIIARLNVGGPARHVAWLTAALRKAGHESVLVAGVVPPGEEDMTYFAAAQGVEPLIIQEMSREISVKDAVTVWKLYRLLRHERPDIVHTHTAKAGTVGRVAGFFYRWLTLSALIGQPRRCRFVHTYHGHVFHSYYGRWKTRIFLFIEKNLARVATDRIVVISGQQYREIHEEYGVGRHEQFAIIPLGLDLEAFSEQRGRGDALRREWTKNEDVADEGGALLIGIVGRLTEIKNHALFLRAAALYKRNYAGANKQQRVRFVIIGDGHLRTALQDLAASLGLCNDVIFTGTRHDPEDFYPALDIVALTSLNEGTPLTLIEAMANERACIATAVGGVVDIFGESVDTLSDSKNGYVVCERGVKVGANDEQGFCAGLARLIEDEALRRKLGTCARRFAEQFYSKERLIADITKLYEELLTPGGANKVSTAPKNLPEIETNGLTSLKGD
ncbi:MAG: glycosyltransferase [Pyrinomonadaceae bacterium]